MKRYMLLHYGFEKPTQEIMEAWGKWFESIGDKMLDQGGFMTGKEILNSGSKDLPFAKDSITGFNIIRAKNIEEAEEIAKKCPFIAGVRVYELRSK